ncbi:MAG: YigZ family protein [Paludibacteraceae bacterium]|nr:YigZ family protein [Paludibacteraceae bacterium]MBQ6561324.1 YigZ family protein [Paludibacteraceae bacterium]MBQ8019947.1 YigZ family protein [Paludibacteraceae bacterium]MBR6112722.1 YigZ family protein [Paludibacteraceae bacterium]
MEDKYLTINAPSEGLYKEKGSKFIAFAVPVSNVEQIKTILEEKRKEHHDARHVCYAYILGVDKADYRSNDDGEPSGTAGRPILGSLLSAGVTNVLIAVVRYFGGTKLGTSGLINAYKVASADALENAEIIEKTVDEEIHISFDYLVMNDVMKIIKDVAPQVMSQQFDNNCNMVLSIRKGDAPNLIERLKKVESLIIED